MGEVNGGGFAPVVYEMPEVRFRGIVLGLGRHPLEGGGQFEEFEEVPELRGEVLAPDLQERGRFKMKSCVSKGGA